MNVYLDDMRPAPDTYILINNIQTIKALLEVHGLIEHLSLDHDLGACGTCMRLYGVTDAQEWLNKSKGTSMPHCPHVGTGYDLVLWMMANGKWPQHKPTVHSANPEGQQLMRAAIDRYFPTMQSVGDEVI